MAGSTTSTNGNRIHWMDNLRTIIIALVVLYHVGGVYEAAGLWASFWLVDDPSTISWVGIVGIVFDIFVMGTLFFISGYLAPASLRNKSGWQFLTGKVKRLLIPWALAVLALIPIYRVIFYFSRGLPQETWWKYLYFNTPNSQNWLWFLPVLFLFNMVYLLASKANIRLPRISLKAAVAGSFVLAVTYSFAAGMLFGFRSWTLTPVLDFENERLLAYFLAFGLGILSYHRQTFAALPQKKTLYIVANSVAWLPLTGHIFVRLWPFMIYPAVFEITPGYVFLWHFTFHLSLITMGYVMIESFWRYLNRTGPVWAELNRNSYGVYIIHVIVIGVFGTLLLYVGLPAVVKYLLLIASTYLTSNALVSLYRRVRTGRMTVSQPRVAASGD